MAFSEKSIIQHDPKHQVGFAGSKKTERSVLHDCIYEPKSAYMYIHIYKYDV
jgi:hypothetical protein